MAAIKQFAGKFSKTHYILEKMKCYLPNWENCFSAAAKCESEITFAFGRKQTRKHRFRQDTESRIHCTLKLNLI